MSNDTKNSPRLGNVTWFIRAGKDRWLRDRLERGVPYPSETPEPGTIGIWRPHGWRGFGDRTVGDRQEVEAYRRWAWGYYDD